jgi:PAS domain-containing protein
MKRFICEQNVAHFRKLLEGATDPIQRRTLERLLTSELRELTMLEAAQIGIRSGGPQDQPVDASPIRDPHLADFDHSPHPYLLLDPGPGLQIVDVNASYAAVTFTDRNEILGRSLFDVFPDDPERPLADGVINLYTSLKTVANTGKPHAMAVQRYDIRNAAGDFVERHWQPINVPVHDEHGRLIYLLHHVEDVTDQVER